MLKTNFSTLCSIPGITWSQQFDKIRLGSSTVELEPMTCWVSGERSTGCAKRDCSVSIIFKLLYVVFDRKHIFNLFFSDQTYLFIWRARIFGFRQKYCIVWFSIFPEIEWKWNGFENLSLKLSADPKFFWLFFLANCWLF